jgi:acyl-CoA synthetase (AMP-forming)/AMP-acid ligase II
VTAAATTGTPTPRWEREREWIELTTIGGVLQRAAARRPDHESLVFVDHRETYAETLAGAERVARSLHALGIARGETVALLMPNTPDFVHTFFGCALLGVRALLVNARYKHHELAYVLGDAGAVAVVTTDVVSEYTDFVPLIDAAAAQLGDQLRLKVMLGSSSPPGFLDREAFTAAGEAVPVEEVRRISRSIRIREVGIMMYTSGTTAEPKGCLISHEALVRTSLMIVDRFELTEDERFWDPLPLFHMAGLLQLMAEFHVGGTFMTMTHFEPGEAIRMMERERCTFAYPCFPTITQAIIHHPDFDPSKLTSVRVVMDTGTPETLRDVSARWNGVPTVTSYGLTEAGGVVTFSHIHDPEEKRVTTSGRPFPGMEVRIEDPETGEELPAGEIGEITLRGPGLFEGYHNDPEKTAETMCGGWLHTGDLGSVDEDGRITYHGRSKDMLKVGGENVAALEIEAFLGTHPAVKLVQVIGVPDPKYLEVPAAFVELVPGQELTEEELVEFCRGKIASFKVPRYVRFVTEWPMSATKIQKHRLREAFLAEQGLADAR